MNLKNPQANEALRIGSTATVVVTCKLPHGAILELNVGKENYRFAKLNGTRSTQMGTAGLTTVPADFMETWMKKNAWQVAVKQGLIAVHGSEETALAHAVDTGKQKNGLEPLTMKDMPRDSRGELLVEPDTAHLKKLGVSIKAA